VADRRLFLFDIDGTLIASGGAGSGAMRAAFNALWRREDGFSGIDFSGRTDRALVHEALLALGLDDGDFEEDLRRFKRAYFRRLHGTLHATKGRVLPGVAQLLTRLGEDDRATLALGTGNFRTSAAMKLRHYGIHGHFVSAGGFGDRTEDRATLIAQAIRSADREAGRHDSVFVIGDTHHDVRAAKDNGAVAIAVATGTVAASQLEAAGADVVLSTLEEASAVLVRGE
jgi:phosphoglycolate phosphatase-like HAD superfamily hydrolase